jgi:hypothetical protein
MCMRSVVYHPQFEDDRRRFSEEFGLDFSRFDDFIRGVESKLARKPEFGSLMDRETGIWMCPAADVFPVRVSVFYTFDETHVHVLALFAHRRTVDPDVDEAE